MRAAAAVDADHGTGAVRFAIKGDGRQTRAFIHVDDFTDGLVRVIEQGEHLNVYHIGNPEEVSVEELARLIFKKFGREPAFAREPAPAGETRRRCPDIGKLRALGFAPKIPLAEGLPGVVAWYRRASRSRRCGASERLDMAASESHSRPILECQICASKHMRSLLFLGYVPPVNTMPAVGERSVEQLTFPLEMFRCDDCGLAQIGLEVSPEVLFPYSYPYLSGTTKILRENFADLYRESSQKLALQPSDLVVDIGSNDGSLLINFKEAGHPVLGIDPSRAAEVARQRGIETLVDYFGAGLARKVRAERGPAKVVTAANVFAHIGDVHGVTDGICELLADDGVFISESHYLLDLIETLQYDTIYHEHLRYYALGSLEGLLVRHGLEVFHVKRIPTHGGSIRVYAARAGTRPIDPSVAALRATERDAGIADGSAMVAFRERVAQSKLALYALIARIAKARHPDLRHRCALARFDAHQLCRARQQHRRCGDGGLGLAQARQVRARHAASRSSTRRGCLPISRNTRCCCPGTSPTSSSPSCARRATAARSSFRFPSRG